ncbi:MAG TPA: amidohydrolase family protein [Methylomirabilota bacterium]|jgi:imidazolonepropionase-like amidohydrolase|nr:amidohydrolase family protein [Methylomirabilota bacterium]
MTVLRGATLIDGTGAAPVRDATLVVQDGRIESITIGAGGPAPASHAVIDATGLTVLPGLIDCHDHLAMHGYELASRWGLSEPGSTRSVRTARVIEQTLAAGYTTVRDAGGLDVGFRLAVEEGLIQGPRLLTAVAIISPVGGIGDRVSPSGHECVVPHDPALPESVANGVEDVRRVVRTMIRGGADVIKCATTGGASSRAGHGPKDPAFSRDEMQALVDEAHAQGRKVMCHALGGPGLRLALDVGVDSIEHGCYLDENPELIPMMAEKGVVFTPTLLVYVYHSESKSPHVRERSRALREHHRASIQRALAAGVRVVAGTDAGGHGHPPNARELPLLVEAGLSPMQAIQAATGWAAEAVGLEREIGTLEKGKRADLIAVAGDPLADVGLLADGQRIRLVLKDGAVVVRR